MDIKKITLSAVLSMLCMPLISFGMDKGTTDQRLHVADLQTTMLGLLADDDASVSSQSDAVNTQLYFPDLQPAQVSVLACEELLDSEVDKEDTQSISHNQAAQEIQPTISMLRGIKRKYEESMHYRYAVRHHICSLCRPEMSFISQKDIEQHFKQWHPSAMYAARGEKIACEKCGKEKFKRDMKRHLENHKRKNRRRTLRL